MLGWHISVFRQEDGGSSPASVDSKRHKRLAVWQAGFRGLEWLDELVKNGQATDLGGDGDPRCFTAQAEHLIPRILTGPPEANPVWGSGPDDIFDFSQREVKTVIDRGVVSECRPDEWLLIVARGAANPRQ